MKFKLSMLAIAVLIIGVAISEAQDGKDKGFETLFDGKTFNGWKLANENQNSWSIKDGSIVAHGERCHLYYEGDGKPFKNFELKLDVMTEPGSNGGIYFHTQYQEKGWPRNGFEVQVNQTHGDWKKTGSLYDVVNVKEQLVKDNEWYHYDITVKDKLVTVKVNDKVAVHWAQPDDWKEGTDFKRILAEGTFALQAHDPKSVVYFKNIRVKRLD